MMEPKQREAAAAPGRDARVGGAHRGDLDDLPPLDTCRWVASRKAQVVAAVRDGRLTFEEACARYNISHEEFASWERAIDRHGVRALRVTRLKEFR